MKETLADLLRVPASEINKIPSGYRRNIFAEIKRILKRHRFRRCRVAFVRSDNVKRITTRVDNLLKKNWRCHGNIFTFNSKKKKSTYLVILAKTKNGTLKIIVFESGDAYRGLIDKNGKIITPCDKRIPAIQWAGYFIYFLFAV